MIYLKRKINSFLADYEYHHRRSTLRSLPKIFVLELSNHCNLKCVMCPRGEPDLMNRDVGKMSMALFKNIIDHWIYYTHPGWFHGFGEPLLNQDIFEQISYAKMKRVPTGISTNATLLTDENAVRLLNSGLDTLIISIDGNNKESYESLRKSSTFTFEQVRDNTIHFLALRRELGYKKPRTVIQMIELKQNEKEWDSYRKYWIEKGADSVYTVKATDWAGQVKGVQAIARQELADRAQTQFNTNRKYPCKFLWESVFVSWEGKVLPCCMDYNQTTILGDLNHQTLSEIWNSDRYVEMRKRELARDVKEPLCTSCSFAKGESQNPLWPLPNGSKVKRLITSFV